MTLLNKISARLGVLSSSLRATVLSTIFGLRVWAKNPVGTTVYVGWWLVNTNTGRNTVLQIFFAGAFVSVIVWGFSVIGPGHFNFGFLDERAGFSISDNFSVFIPLDDDSTYLTLFLVGIQNTILVSVLGIVSAVVLGLTIGILRSVQNFILQRVLDAYTEFFRNTPLLLQLFFWNFALFIPLLPNPLKSLQFGLVFLNKNGLYVPQATFESALPWATLIVSILVALVLSILVVRWSAARKKRTGRGLVIVPIIIALFIVLPIIGFAIGLPGTTFDNPEQGRFNVTGGEHLPVPLLVLWFGLTVYTAAFIGENVRAGIEAVAHGQVEAGASLGLNRWQRLRLIVVPLALRVTIPPTISQLLNLTKNSSLAPIVSYPDLVAIWVGTVANQTGAAVAVMLSAFAVYMTLSLVTSLVANIYNRRVQIAER